MNSRRQGRGRTGSGSEVGIGVDSDPDTDSDPGTWEGPSHNEGARDRSL